MVHGSDSDESAEREIGIWFPELVLSVVLASGSPQRREILDKLGVEFEVLVPGVEELSGGDPVVEVVENARRRLRRSQGALRARFTSRYPPRHGSLGHRLRHRRRPRWEVLGKPADAAEARAYLDRMSGAVTQVMSGLVVLDGRGGAERAGADRRSSSGS